MRARMSGVKIPAFSRPSQTLTPGEGLFPAYGLFSCRDRDSMGRDSRVPSASRRSGRETGAQSLRALSTMISVSSSRAVSRRTVSRTLVPRKKVYVPFSRTQALSHILPRSSKEARSAIGTHRRTVAVSPGLRRGVLQKAFSSLAGFPSFPPGALL